MTNNVDATRILEKGPVYLRKQMELESETTGRMSAVEMLAAIYGNKRGRKVRERKDTESHMQLLMLSRRLWRQRLTGQIGGRRDWVEDWWRLGQRLRRRLVLPGQGLRKLVSNANKAVSKTGSKADEAGSKTGTKTDEAGSKAVEAGSWMVVVLGVDIRPTPVTPSSGQRIIPCKIAKESEASDATPYQHGSMGKEDEFDKLRPLCYTNADIFLLCFSVVSPSSFQNVTEKWVPEIRRHCPQVLVGTQSDLREDVNVLIELAKYKERPVEPQEAHQCAEDMRAVSHMECSSLTQKNLKEVFDAAIVASIQHSDSQQQHRLKKLTPDKMKKLSKSWWKKYCCVA
ncbi:unnamed protein product [Coregonus sp. 'balchen']|nr:unnamed protein product [Coregonus sp. 'balchen']